MERLYMIDKLILSGGGPSGIAYAGILKALIGYDILKKDEHSLRTFIRKYSSFLYKEKKTLVREFTNKYKLDLTFCN